MRGGVVGEEMVEQRRAAMQRGRALQQQGRGGWSSGGRKVGGALYDGGVAEGRMGDVSGRRAVVRLGWRCLGGDVGFGLRVLLWRWRWLMAWALAVFRAIYILYTHLREMMRCRILIGKGTGSRRMVTCTKLWGGD